MAIGPNSLILSLLEIEYKAVASCVGAAVFLFYLQVFASKTDAEQEVGSRTRIYLKIAISNSLSRRAQICRPPRQLQNQ